MSYIVRIYINAESKVTNDYQINMKTCKEHVNNVSTVDMNKAKNRILCAICKKPIHFDDLGGIYRGGDGQIKLVHNFVVCIVRAYTKKSYKSLRNI